jgi:hypothetical protein
MRAFRAWLIVAPTGGLLPHTIRVRREQCLRDFAAQGALDTRREWRRTWREHYRAGYRCERASVTTL